LIAGSANNAVQMYKALHVLIRYIKVSCSSLMPFFSLFVMDILPPFALSACTDQGLF